MAKPKPTTKPSAADAGDVDHESAAPKRRARSAAPSMPPTGGQRGALSSSFARQALAQEILHAKANAAKTAAAED